MKLKATVLAALMVPALTTTQVRAANNAPKTTSVFDYVLNSPTMMVGLGLMFIIVYFRKPLLKIFTGKKSESADMFDNLRTAIAGIYKNKRKKIKSLFGFGGFGKKRVVINDNNDK